MLGDAADTVTALLRDLTARGKIAPGSFLLYVNDGSRDTTWDIITRLHAADSTVRGINLAHNVGHQNALMAGMLTARDMADAIVTMDCDLQDDISAIERMLDKHRDEGADIVFGVKVSRAQDPLGKRLSAQMYYRLLLAMSVETVYNHADFRFMTRRAVDALAEYPERNLYLRGIITALGFRTATVDDIIQPRLAGESKYTLRKMFRLASDGITSFSTRPIELILSLAFAMGLIALCMFGYVAVSLLMRHAAAGWASLMASLWFVGAVVTLAIGIVGIYIGKIYKETKRRPLYTIADRLM